MSNPPNQNTEPRARDRIDRQLAQAGWVVQGKKAIDFNAGRGIAVREYQTYIGPADYAVYTAAESGLIKSGPQTAIR